MKTKTKKKKYLKRTILASIAIILLSGIGIINAQVVNYTHNEIGYQWEECSTIFHDRCGDDYAYQTLLPFDFPYYDMTKPAGTTLYVETNGRLSWTDTTSIYLPTETKFKEEENIGVAWRDMKAYGVIYQCNLDAGGSNERTVITWDTAWYSGDKAVFQVVLYKNGDIIINYANMSNASNAGQTGRGTVYKGVSRGDNTYWTLNTWNNINENLSQKSFKYEYSGTSPTTTTTTSTTTTTTEPTTTTTTTTTPTTTTTTTLPSCELGASCSSCTGWVTMNVSHAECLGSFDGCVRDSNSNTKYDQICCLGVVGGIIVL